MIPLRPRLLLDACLSEPEARLRAWNRWLDLTRFDDIDRASFGLLPSVWHLNRNLTLREGGRLCGLFRHNWVVDQERLRAASPVLASLQREGIEPVLIKGAALAGSVYGSFGARRMADIDVLVSSEHFTAAVEIASAHGLVPMSGFVWPRASVKSWALVAPGNRHLDLHSRPLQAPWDRETEAIVRAQPGTVRISGLTVTTLSPSANLLVALMHGLQYSVGSNFQWILDAALLIRGGGVDWEQVALMARMLEVEYAVSRGLATVAPWVPPLPAAVRSPAGGLHLAQRTEHFFRTREPGGLLGALPNLFFQYRREKEKGLWEGSFAAFLRDAWQVPKSQPLRPVLTEKLARRVLSLVR